MINRDNFLSIKILILLIFLGNGSSFAQNPLDPYLKSAAENNAGLKAAFSEYHSALEMLPQVKALPEPEIMFQYFIIPLPQEMGEQRFNLSASQTFPWFGQNKAQEQAAAEMAKAKYEAFINQKNKLFYEIKDVYYQWYVQWKSVKIISANLEILKSMRELVKIGFESGKSSFVDVLRADMEITKMENELAFLKDGTFPYRAQFEKLLNQPLQGEIIFPDTLWKEDIEAPKNVLRDSLANNPGLKEMEFEISSWQKRMVSAEKMGYPSFTLGATYMNMAKRNDIMDSPENGRDMYMFPEIGIMLPVNRKKYKAMVNESRYKSEAVTFQKTEMKNELTGEFEMIYRDFLDSQRKVEVYSRLSALSRQAREMLLSEFSTAGTEFEEVLRMQEQELMYSLELEEARAMVNSSVALIHFLTGK